MVAMKFFVAPQELVENHYDEHRGKEFYPKVVNYMISGPVVAMVWEGKNIVKVSRDMIGKTNPSDAQPGTVRGDYCITVGRNLIHGSDGVEAANREIALWFHSEELVEWGLYSHNFLYE